MAPGDRSDESAAMVEYHSIYKQAKESAAELDEIDGPIDLDFKDTHAPKLRHLVSFFMWSHMMVMGTVHRLIARNIVDSEYNQDQIQDFLSEEIVSDKFLLDFLKEAEVIDGGLHSKLNRIRMRRNDLAHSARSRALLETNHLETEHLESEVDRAYNAYNEAQVALD